MKAASLEWLPRITHEPEIEPIEPREADADRPREADADRGEPRTKPAGAGA
jgi:hypothetical protein